MGGSPCVTRRRHFELELGYRNQVTSKGGGTSTLTTYPFALVRYGLDGVDEVVILPPNFNKRVVSQFGSAFASATGYEDSGVGVKRTLSANARTQTAVGVFYTAPTGFPTGSSGLGSGGPGYSASFMMNYAITSIIGMNVTETVGSFAGPDPGGTTRRYFASSPSLTLSLALGPRSAFLIQDALTSSTGPGSGSSNRALIAVQRLLSRASLIDLEYEQNLAPSQPMTQQHAVGVGLTLRM